MSLPPESWVEEEEAQEAKVLEVKEVRAQEREEERKAREKPRVTEKEVRKAKVSIYTKFLKRAGKARGTIGGATKMRAGRETKGIGRRS